MGQSSSRAKVELQPGTIETANIEAAKGSLPVLKYLAQYNVYPNEIGANYALVNGQTETVDWLVRNGIHPTSDAANYCVEKGRLDLLQFAEKYGIYPDARGADLANTYQYHDIIDWLASKGIVSNESMTFYYPIRTH